MRPIPVTSSTRAYSDDQCFINFGLPNSRPSSISKTTSADNHPGYNIHAYGYYSF